MAAVLAINRLCAPGSELAVEERWYPATALDDPLEIKEGKINDTRLYRCLDRILPHKTKLEQHLKQRYGELFGAEFDVLLYDLTSTYVEGAAEKNPMMARGYSRDHRPDCEQMVIALIVNSEGFPFSYETFDGNRADVTTMETILRMVERKDGKARRIWVFDRGIVSEENLAAIRKRGYPQRMLSLYFTTLDTHRHRGGTETIPPLLANEYGCVNFFRILNSLRVPSPGTRLAPGVDKASPLTIGQPSADALTIAFSELTTTAVVIWRRSSTAVCWLGRCWAGTTRVSEGPQPPSEA